MHWWKIFVSIAITEIFWKMFDMGKYQWKKCPIFLMLRDNRRVEQAIAASNAYESVICTSGHQSSNITEEEAGPLGPGNLHARFWKQEGLKPCSVIPSLAFSPAPSISPSYVPDLFLLIAEASVQPQFARFVLFTCDLANPSKFLSVVPSSINKKYESHFFLKIRWVFPPNDLCNYSPASCKMDLLSVDGMMEWWNDTIIIPPFQNISAGNGSFLFNTDKVLTESAVLSFCMSCKTRLLVNDGVALVLSLMI